LTSPVQLLFGSFDLAFVIVYLLPLIVIAFTYDILSSERESGTLRLLAAQPIKLQLWTLQKMGIRFLVLTLLIVISLVVVFLATGQNSTEHSGAFINLLGIAVAYVLFWFALAFLINLSASNSAKNAVKLLGLWVLFVLLAPSIINQMGSSLYPIPSRNKLINQMRITKSELNQRQDEILDNFLRDHPEYALNDSTQARGFYHKFMASQDILKEELAPLLNTYEEQLKKQQNWIGQFKWISPAVLTQEGLNQLAGTSTADYEGYRNQVIAFANEWRAHLTPFLYNNQLFTQNDYADLPSFVYQSNQQSSVNPMLFVGSVSVLLFGLGFILASKRKEMNIITQG
jgi:ABC-2 type transport system permease protein